MAWRDSGDRGASSAQVVQGSLGICGLDDQTEIGAECESRALSGGNADAAP